MRVRRFEDAPSRALTEHGSRGATVSFLARGPGVSVVRIDLAPRGVVGMHEAGVSQMLVVVAGSGWVRGGEDGRREPVAAGSVVAWEAGEVHESGSDGGMAALVVEAEGLAPRLDPA
jgi:quercetin dioxygenase-like cupin family protein